MGHCTASDDEYYDIGLLSKQTLPIDRIIQRVWERHRHRIQTVIRPNRIWKDFYDVTPELVELLEKQAYDHVKAVQNHLSEYGYLYYVNRKNGSWYNAVHFEYDTFPLMVEREKVLRGITRLVTRLKPAKDEWNLVCLHLLYFYGVLANPKRNWVTMDYLTNGNAFHQYGTGLYEKWGKEVSSSSLCRVK